MLAVIFLAIPQILNTFYDGTLKFIALLCAAAPENYCLTAVATRASVVRPSARSSVKFIIFLEFKLRPDFVELYLSTIFPDIFCFWKFSIFYELFSFSLTWDIIEGQISNDITCKSNTDSL